MSSYGHLLRTKFRHFTFVTSVYFNVVNHVSITQIVDKKRSKAIRFLPTNDFLENDAPCDDICINNATNTLTKT